MASLEPLWRAGMSSANKKPFRDEGWSSIRSSAAVWSDCGLVAGSVEPAFRLAPKAYPYWNVAAVVIAMTTAATTNNLSGVNAALRRRSTRALLDEGKAKQLP
jgi:hypothetical protein